MEVAVAAEVVVEGVEEVEAAAAAAAVVVVVVRKPWSTR